MHVKPTPLLGGVALFAGMAVAVCCNCARMASFFPMLIGVTLVFIIGVVEDAWGLGAFTRILLQSLISLLVIGMGLHISFLPNTFIGNLGEIVITLIWLVGVTNAYNYLDGMDGLAAGSAAINSCVSSSFCIPPASMILAILRLSVSAHAWDSCRIISGGGGYFWVNAAARCWGFRSPASPWGIGRRIISSSFLSPYLFSACRFLI